MKSTANFQAGLNESTRGLAQVWIAVFGKRVRAYRFFGYTGATFALALSLTLAAHCGLSQLVILVISFASVLAFFLLVLMTKLVTGEERIIYYHHEIGAIVAASLVLRLLGERALPFLDIIILAIGVFLAFGRLGCLMAGCCHGRPHRWGLMYNQEHARDGFPHSLVGAKLFPIQAVESLYVAIVVLLGVFIILRQHEYGEVLACYCAAYGMGRFYFEFARGDSARPYYFGFSQAQWISVLQTSAGALAAVSGDMPFRPWHVAVAILLPVTMAAISFRRSVHKGIEIRLF